jgi:hypothetical protein
VSIPITLVRELDNLEHDEARLMGAITAIQQVGGDASHTRALLAEVQESKLKVERVIASYEEAERQVMEGLAPDEG